MNFAFGACCARTDVKIPPALFGQGGFAMFGLFMEPLNKSSAAVSGSFPPTLRYQKRGIHKVFLRFRYLDWSKNLSLTALADVVRCSLKPRIDQYRVRLEACPLAKASHWGDLRRQGRFCLRRESGDLLFRQNVASEWSWRCSTRRWNTR